MKQATSAQQKTNLDSNAFFSEAFKQLDKYCDCFARTKDIVSDLLYGDKATLENPWVTVIIPTYNRQEYLREAISSVLQQCPTDFAWDLLIADNTPLDENRSTPALKIVQELNDPRIFYYHNRINMGSGYNWNRGVELARGEWICFLHDDDLLMPSALNDIARIIRNNSSLQKKLGYIQARRVEFCEVLDFAAAAKESVPYCIEYTRFGSLIRGHSFTGMPSCGTAISKEAYLSVGGVNYDFGGTADAILGYQIMKYYTVLLSDAVLGGYRWAENETLKRSTLIGLAESDLLFARYRYSQDAFSWMYGKIFGPVQHAQNVQSKIDIAKHGNVRLTNADFGVDMKPKMGWIREKLYMIVTGRYWSFLIWRAQKKTLL